MKYIGLIAAMKQESQALLRLAKRRDSLSLGPFQAEHIEIAGIDFLLVTSGMGMRRAGEAARKLIEYGAPDWIISFGIAGAVEPELAIGDVVLVDSVCQWMDGATTSLASLYPWNENECDAAARLLAERGQRLYHGTAVTTRGSQLTRDQLANLPHPVLEMETAGLAQAAIEKGVSLSAIRSISDGPAAPIPFDLAVMMDENANMRYGKILAEIARHPRMVSGLRDMMMNTSIAADNAAQALIQMLSIRSAGEGSLHSLSDRTWA